MSDVSRRALLGASVLTPVAVALFACGTSLTPAQIVSDAGTIASGLSGVMKQIMTSLPNLIPAATATQIEAYLADASSAAGGLSANLPASSAATTVQQIDGWINAVLTTLASPPVNGLIPAPYNTAIAAVAALLPELEAFVNQYIPTAGVTPAALTARAVLAAQVPAMAADTARAILSRYASGS